MEAERRERAAFKALARELGVPLQKARWTPQHQAIWDKGVRRKAKEKLEAERDERRKQRLARQAAEADGKAEQAKALEEKRRIIREKYGFTLGKVINTPEEIEDRKRAEALYEEQANWTPEQWAAWEKNPSAKECPQGSPQWLVREVVKYLAQENGIPEDAVMERIMELDGLDFLLKGAESFGERRCCNKGIVLAAVRALALYLDPDHAAMFGNRGTGNGKQGTGIRFRHIIYRIYRIRKDKLMKKIPTLSKRTFDEHHRKHITFDVTPGLEWVLEGRGIATVKYDGTCCALIDGKFYRRYDAKKGKTPPAGAIPCCDPDPVTGHWPHWLECDFRNTADNWHLAAFYNAGGFNLKSGTYEAVGPHFQSNPYNLP